MSTLTAEQELKAKVRGVAAARGISLAEAEKIVRERMEIDARASSVSTLEESRARLDAAVAALAGKPHPSGEQTDSERRIAEALARLC